MSVGEILYIVGALLAVMVICSLPMLANLRSAGRRYRAAVAWGLAVGWGVAVLAVGWMILGGWAIEAGGRWLGTYRDITLFMMGAFFPLLIVGIRVGKRTLAAAQAADRGLTA